MVCLLNIKDTYGNLVPGIGLADIQMTMEGILYDEYIVSEAQGNFSIHMSSHTMGSTRIQVDVLDRATSAVILVIASFFGLRQFDRDFDTRFLFLLLFLGGCW